MNTTRESSNESEKILSDFLKKMAAASVPECCTRMNSSTDGLSSTDAEALLKKVGLNEISAEKTPSWFKQLVSAFINPFSGILVLIVIVSVVVNVFFSRPEDADYKTVYVVVTIILLSSLLRFFQEYASNNAARNLKAMVKSWATVVRDGNAAKETDMKQLVPGDVILLSAGDMIPGDCRVLQSKDLFVSESVLTGESMPVEKKVDASGEATPKTIFELDNICFMGTNVVSGSARALVLLTGNRAYLGTVQKDISQPAGVTSFEKGVNSVSWLLIRFMLVMVPAVFVINLITKHNWPDALLFSIAIAVGLTPEMLPMIVTANLSRGALRMSRKKVIVKRINAIQNFGAMDVLCTDKTGTLTMDQIVLERYLNVNGIEDKEVLKWAFLNSYYQTGLKNLMDVAVLQHKEWEDHLNVEKEYKKIDEIPFDFQRRRMSVVLERPDGEHILITKGAVEEMLDLCSGFIDPGADEKTELEKDTVQTLDATQKARLAKLSTDLNKDGLRVLAIGIRTFKDRPATYSPDDEKDLRLAGFIGFLDPPKPSARPAIDALETLGIRVIVLTGDNAVVTGKICREVDIPVHNIRTGLEVEQMDDAALAAAVEDTDVFAKLTPSQKSRIIRTLKTVGHTVGYMGDGINDAGALKNADVGISVETAVDIAKESADIILLEKDLMVLAHGVTYGRQTFGNIIKYIKMTASSNFGNMFSMLGASIMLPFLPMLPIQLLLQNLLYDFSQSTIPWDNMDESYLVKPRKWEATGLARFMFIVGPASSVFDYATFGLLYFVFKANAPEHQSLFQSGWFVEGLLSQTLIVHLIRTERIPFIQSRATAPVVVATLLVAAAGIYLPFSPIAGALHFCALPPAFFGWLCIILVAYGLLTQLVKTWFIRRFHNWL